VPGRQALAVAVAAGLLLVVGCSKSGSDPGAPGGKTELDGGEAGTGGGSTSTTAPATTGGTTAGATQGNPQLPGETTLSTAQRTGG
jgi:hypothetical protein